MADMSDLDETSVFFLILNKMMWQERLEKNIKLLAMANY